MEKVSRNIWKKQIKLPGLLNFTHFNFLVYTQDICRNFTEVIDARFDEFGMNFFCGESFDVATFWLLTLNVLIINRDIRFFFIML